MIYAAVFILSFSSLAFEILLTRTFSITQWNHLAFMVISVALLGFAASGIFLNLLSSRGVGWESSFSRPLPLAALLTLFSSTVAAAQLILNLLPLDYFMLPVQPIQLLYIFMAYCVLAFPYFICGMVFSIAYAGFSEKAGWVYFCSMCGSAMGALIPISLIHWFNESTLILIMGIVPLVQIPFFVLSKNRRVKELEPNRTIWTGIFMAGLSGVVLSLGFGLAKDLYHIHPSEYKALSQILKFPDTKIDETQITIRGRLDTVKSKYIRYAPGLSIKYKGRLPEQQAVYIDGDMPLVFYEHQQAQSLSFTDFTLDKCGYLLPPAPGTALVVLKSGGMSLPCALASDIDDITVICENPRIADHIKTNYNLDTYSQHQRSYLRNTNQHFDIIHIDNRGASLPGASALEQDYSFTREAFKSYFSHLSPNGRIIITRRLILPPSDMIRITAAAYESLRSMGIEKPDQHMAILRNWENYVLIVCRAPLIQCDFIKAYASEMNFDVVFVPGITPDTANRFNIFEAPYYFDAVSRLFSSYKSNSQNAYFNNSLSDVVPQTDNRPFPYKQLKWHKIHKAFKSTGSRPYRLFFSGEILVVVVFLEALFISFLFLVVPPMFLSRTLKKINTGAMLGYFFWVGAGFMFVEMYFIKTYVLLFGNPVVSFTVVLAGILISSGIGGAVSQLLRQHSIRPIFITLLCVLLAGCLMMPFLIFWILDNSEPVQFIIAFLIILLPGFLMGFPFSSGMRMLTTNAQDRAYAWAANGCASVLTAVLSAHIALNMGIKALLICAIIAYAIGCLFAVRKS